MGQERSGAAAMPRRLFSGSAGSTEKLSHWSLSHQADRRRQQHFGARGGKAASIEQRLSNEPFATRGDMRPAGAFSPPLPLEIIHEDWTYPC